MPNVTYASKHRSVSAVPPQLACFGPAAEAMFDDICGGEQPIVPADRQRSFIVAVLDEIGRGTHPADIRDRLLKCLEEQERVPRAA